MKFLFFLECKIGLIPFFLKRPFLSLNFDTNFIFVFVGKIKGLAHPYVVVQPAAHHVLLRHVAELLVPSPAKDGNFDKLINIS